MTQPAQGASEMMNCSDVLHFFNRKSRQWLYDLMRLDPTFPRPQRIGKEFSQQWRRSELLAWLDAQPRQDLTGVSIVDRRKAHAARRQVVEAGAA